MHLTEEAYLAMIKFLEKYYFLTKSDEIGGLLSGMSIIGDGKPLDMAMWGDYALMK